MSKSNRSGWEVKKLGEIATFINGKAFKPEDWKSQGLPIIRIQNLTDLNKEFNYYDKEIESKYFIQNGDILISWSATLDIFEWNRGDAVLNQHIFKVVFDKLSIDKKFFKYLVSTKIKEMENYSHGATMKHIVKADFYNIEIPLPPLKEQIKIASILEKADKLRQKRKQANKMYDEFLQSVFLDMFGDPVTNPKNFQVQNLKVALVNVTNGLSRRRKEFENIGDVVLRLREIRENNIDYSDINRISLTIKEKQKYKVDRNDLLFIRVNGNKEYVGRCAIFKDYTEDVYFNDHIMRVKIDKKFLNPIFISSFLNNKFGKSEISNHIKTSAGQYTISQGGLEQINLYFPPIELQNKFASIVEKVESLKEKAKKSEEEIENLFNSLMQNAFNGNLDLSECKVDIEKQLAEV